MIRTHKPIRDLSLPSPSRKRLMMFFTQVTSMSLKRLSDVRDCLKRSLNNDPQMCAVKNVNSRKSHGVDRDFREVQTIFT